MRSRVLVRPASASPATLLLRALFVTAVALPALLHAQGAKKPLTQDAYDLWRSITQPVLSADGAWAVYTVTPTVGDGELIARSTSGKTEYRAPRGWTGRPITTVGSRAFTPAAARITGDGKHIAFVKYPAMASMDSARARKVRPADMPKNSLSILSLADGRITDIPRVSGFEMARDGGKFVVYKIDADTTRAAARGKDAGSLVIVRNLASGAEVRLDDVTNYALDNAERWLVYTRTGADSLDIDGIYARDFATGTVVPLKTGKGNYRSIALADDATQVAFITDADRPKADSTAPFALYVASLGTAARPVARAAAAVVTADAPSLGKEYRIAEKGAVRFVKGGGSLRFEVQQVPAVAVAIDSLADVAVVDLWHWKDARLQSMQRLDASRDRDRTFAAIVHLGSRRMLRLANDSMPGVQLSADGRTAVAVTDYQYELDAISGEGGNDVHVINTLTGDTRQVATRIRASAQLSPGAKYVVWWDETAWRVHDVAGNRTRALTAGIEPRVSFARETHDTPDDINSWGIGGWTTDDKRVLVYDRFDIWELDPAGVAAPRNLTDGEGRRQNITFRLANLGGEATSHDPSKPLMLRAFDNGTKHSGIYRERLGKDIAPERLVMAAKSWPVLAKASKAEQYLVARADYREYPDLWTGKTLDQLERISDAMPEQREYRWGDVELVKWLNADGVELEGLLFKPEGFDASKQYPMVVYFYEQLADGLHNYVRPAGRNIINAPVYTSLGYLVFMPNIHYTAGYPGPSAVKSIVPGVQSLIAKGFVHPKKVGIAGQSWGGYQASYIITQTNMFAAAVPNATVVNMTSAYGGIRWDSGVERAIVNYERGQSRIGGSLWEFPERYIENSALFYLDRVKTPVLFMANDNDGAVPWYQGIEFFVAMRRLGKEAYMLNYNGDAHNPVKYANQKDIDRRMQEFFGAKLMGAPEPAWMKSGIPFLQKGKDQRPVVRADP